MNVHSESTSQSEAIINNNDNTLVFVIHFIIVFVIHFTVSQHPQRVVLLAVLSCTASRFSNRVEYIDLSFVFPTDQSDDKTI